MRAENARMRTVTLWDRFVTGEGLVIALAALLVLAVTYPIQDANWVRGLAPPVIIGLLSVWFTTLMARTDLAAWRIHLITLGAGAFVVLVTAAAMMDGTPELFRVLELWDELEEWTAAISTDEVRSGIVEFGMFLTTMSWSLGHIATWTALRHRQGWVSVAFGGAALAIALSNSAGSTALWLSLFMAASVLLLIHMATAQRMVGWRSKRLVFEPRTVLVQSGIILGAGVLIILLVSVIPTPNRAPLGVIAEALEDTSRSASDMFSRLFNGLPSRLHVHTLTYEQTTQFRGNPNLTDDLLFTVGGATANYWRARTYTNYTSTGWETEAAEWGEFAESEGEDRDRRPSTHDFVVTAATDTLFHPGLAGEFDQPVEALAFDGDRSDTLQVRFTEGRDFFPTRTNLRYTSTGSRSTALPSALQLATGNIPRDVIERYTQLPTTLPKRVNDLAAEVAGGAQNQFDTVERIRNFILSYPYNLEISAPPDGADGVDYFLFDLRQGYCDYFASSLAVMLRTLGIPSRYVLGYASGQWDPTIQRWQVLQLNYHSWVEVYFPEYGWIRFEATPPDAIEFGGRANPAAPPSLLDLIDLEGGVIPEDEEEEDFFDGDFDPNSDVFITIGRLFGFAVLASIAFILVVYYRWWFRLRYYARADELYAKMQRLATLLGLPPGPSQTPVEYGEVLATEMPEFADGLRELSRVYSDRRYAGKPVPMGDLRKAEVAWAAIRWGMIRRMFRVRPA